MNGAMTLPHLALAVALKLFVLNKWRRHGAEFGGDGKIFRGPRFQNKVFWGKEFPFSRLKFLIILSCHRQGFSDFSFLFPDFACLYYVKCLI